MHDIHIDGASSGNPGPSGVGIFIKSSDGTTWEYSLPIGETDNHTAEFIALQKALEIAQELGLSVLSIKTDSQLVDLAVSNEYVKKERYAPYLQAILSKMEQFDLVFVKWVPSKQNRKADELARQGIQKQKK